jgi:hypothetical protein
VFLSHSSKDTAALKKLVAVLRDHGIKVWYSEKHIRGATQWHDEIGKALKRCDWFCVLLTPDSVKSKWVKREVHYALRSDRYEDRVIPLIFKNCDMDELSWVLSGLQTITVSRRWKKAMRELLAVWGRKYND